MEETVFFLAALLAIAGALGVVLIQNPFYSVLALVLHLFALAVLFLLLSAQFLAAAQIVVYAGAVMVLYVFVTAYIGGSDEPLRAEGGGIATLGPLFAGALFIELTIAIVGSGLALIDSGGPEVDATFGTPAQVGELLLGKFLLAFEAASYLLLVAAVGAVVLARRRRGLEPEPGGAGVAEATGGRAGAAEATGGAARGQPGAAAAGAVGGGEGGG